MRGLILLLFMVSGFAGLTYELTWTKQLTLIFGVSSGAISTVLAAFMCGLALGSALLGRTADRSRRPLALYGVLEVGIGVSAFCLRYVFDAINSLHVALAQSMPGGAFAFIILRYLLCFAALLVPTALMGGTLPAVSRAWVREQRRIGGGVGLLYGLNTLGAVLGTLATGFLLLRILGAGDTIRTAVTLNLMAGFTSLWLARRTGATALPTLTETTREHAADESRPEAGLLLGAFAVAGATSLAYEVLWTRVLIYFTGQTVYAFSVILACFLTGIALGSLASARLADRMRDRVAAFGLLELLIGLSAAYLLLVIRCLYPLGSAASRLLPVGIWPVWFAITFALLLAPALLMGAVMPVVTRAYTRRVEQLGGGVGVLYAANTAGCVVGSLGAGFGLLPWLGAQRAVLAVAGANVLLGVVVLCSSRWAWRRKLALGMASTAVLVLGMWLSWHPRALAMHKSDYMQLKQQLLYYHEGSEASLAVLANPEGSRELNINGNGTAFTDYDDIVVHKMLAHVPMLLAGEVRRALVVGFGLGSTSWSILQYPVERVVCVELVPEEQESAAFFLDDNKGVLEQPRFRFVAGDGRNYLLTTTEGYDVISLNAINPSLSPYLYTQEFYELCRRRLRPGGLVCAWIPTNMSRFPTLARTFQTVFPHATLWFCNPFHALLIATPEPLSVDLETLAPRMARPEVQRDLAEVQLADPIRLLSTLLLDENGLRGYVEGAEVNRDDLPHVEFETTLSRSIGIKHVAQMMLIRARPWEHLAGPASEEDKARLRRYWAAAPPLARGWTAHMLEIHSEALTACQHALAVNPEDPRARYLQAMAAAEAWRDTPGMFPSADARRQTIGVLEAGLRHEEIPHERFVATGRAVLGLLYAETGRIAKAREQARAMYRTVPEPPEQAMLRAAVGDP
ncbi:MAG: fused MFS/spermidine synthase [Planctomycetota bacterium]|jgi:spermidine synthase